MGSATNVLLTWHFILLVLKLVFGKEGATFVI
jgi:hypothetical protein